MADPSNQGPVSWADLLKQFGAAQGGAGFGGAGASGGDSGGSTGPRRGGRGGRQRILSEESRSIFPPAR